MRLGANFTNVEDAWFEDDGELRVASKTSRYPEVLTYPDARRLGSVPDAHKAKKQDDQPEALAPIGAKKTALSANGRWMAALGKSFAAVLDATTHAIAASFPTGELDGVRTLAISNDGLRIATVRETHDGTETRLWDVKSGRPFEDDPSGRDSGAPLVAHGGGFVASGPKMGGSIDVWDLATRQRRATLTLEGGGGLWRIAAREDGTIAALDNHAVSLWKDDKRVASWHRPESLIDRTWTLAFTQTMLSVDNALLDVPSLSAAAPRVVFRGAMAPSSVVTADGTSYAFVLRSPDSTASVLKRWKPREQPTPFGLERPDSTDAVAIDAQGTVMLARETYRRDDDLTAHRYVVIDLVKKKVARTLGGEHVALSPDGKLAASTSPMQVGSPINSPWTFLECLDHEVIWDVAFSPDGHELLIGAGDYRGHNLLVVPVPPR